MSRRFEPAGAAVGGAEAEPVGEPDEVGLSSRRLGRIAAVLGEEVEAGRMPGAVVGVARRGRLVYLEAFGHRDAGAGTPMTTDTLFWIASMTKPVTAVGAMVLHEQGRLALDAPIERYLPEFADRRVGEPVVDSAGSIAVRQVPARRQPTVLDLLRHTSGLVEGMLGSSPVHHLYTEAVGNGMTPYTGAEFARRLVGLPLLHQPGETWHYGFGPDLVGLIVESVTGQSFGEYLREAVFSPLAMVDTGFGVRAGQQDRYARPLPTDPDTGLPQRLPDLSVARFDSGGAGLVSTAADYLRFGQLLLGGGQSGNVRLLGRKTVQYMTSDQLDPGTDTAQLAALQPGYGFGLGMAVRRATGGGPTAGSAGELTWAGSSGTLWWADPAEHLGVVFMTHTPSRVARRRYHPLIRTLVLQAIVD